MGSFETEVMSWVYNLRLTIQRHERFTWINLFLAITPSPPAGLMAIILATVQLILVSKNKIPESEKIILISALILGICNAAITSVAIYYLINTGATIWDTLNPLLWFKTLQHKIYPPETYDI